MKLTGQTVLVVDDSSDDRFFIERALARLASGLSVQFVASGDEAVAYLNGCGRYADRLEFPYPSFVITDLNMSEGDGFSVLRHLQSTARGTRAMMLSSSEEAEHRRRAYDLGASAYCVKPHAANGFAPIISTFLLPEQKVEGSSPARAASGASRYL
jgi:CheY-like chemotaxis protein